MSILYVGKANGWFQTIAEAVAHCRPGGVIKIAEGLYFENIVIDKGLTLQALDDAQGNIIVVSMNNATILIDAPMDQKCLIKDINMSHCGFNEDMYWILNLASRWAART